MSQQWVDLAILGGGCAGLSLARELSLNKDWQQKTIIIEPRTSYFNDRSWCFWEPLDVALQKTVEPLIQHSWQQWRFSGAAFSQIHSSKGRRYCHVAAEDFYQQAIAAVDNSQHVELHLGKSVKKVENTAAGFLILLEDGSSLCAHQVVDTRPSIYHHKNQAQLWQIFYGHEIETSHELFDETMVGLMENLTGKTTATQFLYVLPFSKKRALLEFTQFSTELFAPEKFATDLNQYLLKNIGKDNFNIIRTEQACLPMGLKSLASSNSTNYHYAGTVAGAMRPATGYAFIRIQQWARLCARQLCSGGNVLPVRQSTRLVKSMDRIFLNVLQDTPTLGAALFQALAEHVSGQSLVRFLMDEAGLKDYFQVVKALPTLRLLAYGLGLNHFLFPQQATP